MNDYGKIIEKLENFERILIFTHTNMDGDAAGSALALCRFLTNEGKQAHILMEDEFPKDFEFLFKTPDEKNYPVFEVPFEEPYLAVALDMSDVNRLEKRKDAFFAAKAGVCIDHHPVSDPMGDASVVDPSCSATSLLIYEMMREHGLPVDRDIAEAVYVGILTDTGSFRYSNCDKRTMEAVASLYDYGIDSAALCSAIYDNCPLARLKLEALAVERAFFPAEGRGVISHSDRADLEALGADESAQEGCIDRIRCIEGVELAAFMKEKEEGVWKVSLRAKSFGDVNKIAKAFGGGGHVKAAGCTVRGSLEEVAAQLARAMEDALKCTE